MKRGHTVLEYKQKIRRLREARPGIALSSDFIVGFPGETDRDFDQTLALVEELNFDISFSFIYSPRPGTPRSESCGPDAAERQATPFGDSPGPPSAPGAGPRRGNGSGACSACW